MSNTLTYTDTLHRVGLTTIGDRHVVQYDAMIPTAAPETMTIHSAKLNYELYKENREICRADLAEFEDMCYAIQDELIAKKEAEEAPAEE